jgi:hypothetical protein
METVGLILDGHCHLVPHETRKGWGESELPEPLFLVSTNIKCIVYYDPPRHDISAFRL